MPEEWSGTLIGKMHNNNVTRVDLAKETGMSKGYVTMILKGYRKPEGAKERLEAAYEAVLKKRKANAGSGKDKA